MDINVEFKVGATIEVPDQIFKDWCEENDLSLADKEDRDYAIEEFVFCNFCANTYHRDYSGETSYAQLTGSDEVEAKIYHETYEGQELQIIKN